MELSKRWKEGEMKCVMGVRMSREGNCLGTGQDTEGGENGRGEQPKGGRRRWK